jgi:hypothetical protein
MLYIQTVTLNVKNYHAILNVTIAKEEKAEAI